MEDPQSYDLSSSTLLLGDDNIPKTPLNPNLESSPRRSKRSLVPKESETLIKKARKRRSKADSEVAERSPPPTPEWLVRVMKDMEEADNARFIFENTLSASDVSRNMSRLLIPIKQIKRNDFLTQEEKIFIEQEQDEEDEIKDKHGLGAILVNQRSEKWGIILKRWVMKKKTKDGSQNATFNYALNCGWNEVVKGNRLKAGDKISLWYFRSGGQRRGGGVLCFALGTE